MTKPSNGFLDGMERSGKKLGQEHREAAAMTDLDRLRKEYRKAKARPREREGMTVPMPERFADDLIAALEQRVKELEADYANAAAGRRELADRAEQAEAALVTKTQEWRNRLGDYQREYDARQRAEQRVQELEVALASEQRERKHAEEGWLRAEAEA